jgi:hypothetical protein
MDSHHKFYTIATRNFNNLFPMKNRLLFVALLGSANAYASCGSSFCSVNTHWDTQGLVNDDVLRVDLRYSYANANTLRSGSKKIVPAQPSGSDTEIENLRTINQMLNLDLDYSANQKWNVGLDLPLVMRDHTHTFDSSVSGPFVQQAKFTGLGDARVVGKYKFDSVEHHAGSGMSFGIKLPTGAINKTMTPPDPANPSTPYALERSSQPGTGSTDLLLGTYYHSDIENSPWGWFVSGQWQSAVSTRDDYRPGNSLNLDMGAHYAFAPALTGLLQLNTQFKNRDTGLNANPASGGHSLNLSPGLSFVVAPKTNLYSFVQVALLQYANTDPAVADTGQLTAPWSFAIGISRSY